jgi:nucleoside diphosphate kinase
MTVTTVPRGLPLPAALSCLEAKRDYYGSDVYYLESAEQLTAMLAGHDLGLADFARDHALLLLKPDAVVSRQLLPAIDWLDGNGFSIVAARRTRLTRTTLRALWQYQWNLSTVYRRRLADRFLCGSDSLVLLVRPRNTPEVPASVLLTELKGPTNPAQREPGQLRYLLGRYCYLLNLVHTADEPADVLRELAVYFGTEERAAVYADALSGSDQRDRARELARELYAEVPVQELDFGPAAGRLAAATGNMLAAGGLAEPLREILHAALARGTDRPETWRPLLELIWTHDLAFDPWDVTVVGCNAFPMRRAGVAPVLGGAGSADWRRHLAAAPRAEFARTVDRDSAHRRAVSEVFLTSVAQVDDATFDLGTQIPRQHGYFSDHVGPDAGYDPMFFVEACRQGMFVIAHSFLGAPIGHHFILRRVELAVTDPALLAVREAPTDARIRCRIERRYRDRNSRDAGFQLRCRAEVDEREALSCLVDVRWVSPERYAGLRGAARAVLAPSPRAPRLPAGLLGRRNPGNVLISPLTPPSPDPDAGPAWSAGVVVDQGHPTLFDHPLDHIPGMLQLEAMRQLATAVLVSARDVPASSVRLAGLDVRFARFGELGLPARCLTWAPGADQSDTAQDGDLTLRCAVHQAGAAIADGRVRLGLVPRLALPVSSHAGSTPRKRVRSGLVATA